MCVSGHLCVCMYVCACLFPQAIPSLAEKLYQQFKSKKEQVNKTTKEDILNKYGSAAEKPPEELALLAGTEKYVEYDRMGRVVKGQVRLTHTHTHTHIHVSWPPPSSPRCALSC